MYKVKDEYITPY